MKYHFLIILLIIQVFSQQVYSQIKVQNANAYYEKNVGSIITPNQFKKGSDSDRIEAAISDALKAGINSIEIPRVDQVHGKTKWLVDRAILLPSNMTVILDNCTIQLADQCRDNMFRSNNSGIGITDPKWNNNISIIGIGDVILKGADNPRATGDEWRKLVLSGKGRVSYGSDAGKEGMKQTGDWRNIMILMAYVNGFQLKNIKIENSHAWAISLERTINADISDIVINSPEEIVVKGKNVQVYNRDGIDIRIGCKNLRINNFTGSTGDDFIALSLLDENPKIQEGGSLNSTMVTSRKWRGPEDDIEKIFISNINCKSLCRGIAIRANDSTSINNVYINGLFYDGHMNALLVGGRGYGTPSLPGKINNIKAMNIIGNGASLILIEEPISDCYFMNCMYSGNGKEIITYNLDKDKTTRDVESTNMVKMP